MLIIYVLEYKIGGVFISLNPDFGEQKMSSVNCDCSCFTKRRLCSDNEYEITHFFVDGQWVEYDEAIENGLINDYKKSK